MRDKVVKEWGGVVMTFATISNWNTFDFLHIERTN